MAKNDLKNALAHAEAVSKQREFEEEMVARKLAEQKKKEQKLIEKQKLEELQKDCTNLYSWTVLLGSYALDNGIVWAENIEEVEKLIGVMYPYNSGFTIEPIDRTKKFIVLERYGY